MELRVPLLFSYHLAINSDEPWLEIPALTGWEYLLAGTGPDFNRFLLTSSEVLYLSKVDVGVFVTQSACPCACVD